MSSDVGDDNEAKFVELRTSQGYLSTKRNRPSWKRQRRRGATPDFWGMFDVFSMNADGQEFAQVKTADRADTRGALKKVAEWIQENRDKIPPNTSFVVAVYITPDDRFYVREVDWQ